MDTTNFSYFDFCPALQKILVSGQIPVGDKTIAVHSGSTVNNLRVLRELIRSDKPVHTMEIGLAFGVSALAILATLQETASGNYRHTAIDPLQAAHWHNAGVTLIGQAGLTDHFRFMETYSGLALPDMLSRQESFDLIYIDGSHQFDHVFIDYYYCIRLLRKGGVVVFDDCTTADVAAVVKFIQREHKQVSEPVNLSPYDDPAKPLLKKVANGLGFRQLKAFRKMVDTAPIL